MNSANCLSWAQNAWVMPAWMSVVTPRLANAGAASEQRARVLLLGLNPQVCGQGTAGRAVRTACVQSHFLEEGAPQAVRERRVGALASRTVGRAESAVRCYRP